jgi:hypothetical protein
MWPVFCQNPARQSSGKLLRLANQCDSRHAERSAAFTPLQPTYASQPAMFYIVLNANDEAA